MSANHERPHLLVLPEDDANRQIAVGFRLKLADVRRMQLLPIAHGWRKAVESFGKVHVREMQRNLHRHLLLLIDFDGDANRIAEVHSTIPEQLKERVYVLGSLQEPERLKRDLGSYETIGVTIANSCHGNADAVWNHSLLQHNATELQRLRQNVRPFLFPGQ